jgi:hypothetical protein
MLLEEILIEGHTQVRLNLEPGLEARGLTLKGASRSSLWLIFDMPFLIIDSNMR